MATVKIQVFFEFALQKLCFSSVHVGLYYEFNTSTKKCKANVIAMPSVRYCIYHTSAYVMGQFIIDCRY